MLLEHVGSQAFGELLVTGPHCSLERVEDVAAVGASEPPARAHRGANVSLKFDALLARQ